MEWASLLRFRCIALWSRWTAPVPCNSHTASVSLYAAAAKPCPTAVPSLASTATAVAASTSKDSRAVCTTCNVRR